MPSIIVSSVIILCAVFSVLRAVPIDRPTVVDAPLKIAVCPTGSRIMYRPDGEPRKCLPHQSNLCLNALDDKTDASTVCCWHNQVDYYCCIDVAADQCPQYSNVTVVIHNNFPHSAFPLKTFHFRRDIEKEVDFAQRT